MCEEGTRRPIVDQIGLGLGNIPGIYAGHRIAGRLEEKLYGEIVDIGKHFAENKHAHQDA